MQSTVFGKLPGEKFGNRYQIERQLGKRAGIHTLLARDLQTQSQVVIKRLSFGEDFAWDDLKLFEREAATLKNLSHPAIPRYLDYFDLDLPSGKGFALVQTYIAAKSLEEQIQAGRSFSESEIVELAAAVLEILQYLHERAPTVIHRDIKPSNLLLGDRSGSGLPCRLWFCPNLSRSGRRIYHGRWHLWLHASRTIWRSRITCFRLIRFRGNPHLFDNGQTPSRSASDRPANSF
jgi:serine/threonine protein kinase